MRLKRILLASIALAAMAALLLPQVSSPSAAKAAVTLQENASKGAVLFVVSAQQLPNAQMVPFAIYDQGQFKPPVAGDSDAEEIARFASAYYAKGRKYQVLFGGGTMGSLTVAKANKDEECARTSADVTLRTAAKLNRNVMALATDSDSLGGAKTNRRAPTAAERAALMPLVKTAYQQKGVPAALLSTLMTINLTALDLDNDGKSELIGSFVVKKQKGGAARYALFLFAEPQGQSYRTTVLQYARFTSDDIMTGADLSAIENGVYLERLVDALDFNGDGTAEVVTVTDGLEGDGYAIYQKQGGKWNKAYEFSNYRCAF
jgi:hypothetical protein